MRAEDIRIECDEDGFHLRIQVIDGEADPVLDFLVLDPDQLHHEVKTTIGAHRYEIQQAAREYRLDEHAHERMTGQLADLHDLGTKHPDWHSVAVEHYDVINHIDEEGAA